MSAALEAAGEALSRQMNHFSWAWRRTETGDLVYRDPAAAAQRERHMEAAAAVLRVAPPPPALLPGYRVVPDEKFGPSIWHYADEHDGYPQHVLSRDSLPRTRPGSPAATDHTLLWDHLASACRLHLEADDE